MKTKNFYDIHQAYAYIADRVIRFKGQPVYVHEIGFYDGPRGPYELIFRYIGEHPANFGKALTNDPQIDMSPVPLGLLSYPGEDHRGSWKKTVMVSRVPVRKWKWGLSVNNIHIGVMENRYLPPAKADVIVSAALRDTIMG